MAQDAPLPAFVHDPLPDSKTHIRLLEVLQGNFGQHVVCKLSAWPLDSAPPYNAISYTWGDPASTVNITVDGRTMVVRQNCEYVLQQAFTNTKKETKYLWVDAICIDQSTLQERGHQVALMGELYKRATHVFACVGAHADDSGFLSLTCSKQKRILKTIADLPDRDGWEMSSLFGIGLSSNLAFRSVCAISPAAKLRIFNAFMAFVSRSYFTRVWILQELYMGSHVSFCCGADIIPSEQMIAISSLVQVWCERPSSRSWVADRAMFISRLLAKCTKKEINSDMYRAYHDSSPRRFCLSLAFGIQGLQSPHPMLRVVHQTQCTDERDKIYGILSLVDWPSGIAPVPDYDKSALDLAIETFGILFYETNSTWGKDFFQAVDFLVDFFNLLPMYESIKEATSTTPEPVGSRTRIEVSRWHATKIYPPSSGSDRFAQLQVIRAPDDNEMNLLIDNNGVPYAEASARTQVGDWYVRAVNPALDRWGMLGLDRWDMLGLIVRTSKNSSLTIVGLARKLGNHHHRVLENALIFRKEQLVMHWDLEDAFLLHMSVRNGIPNSGLDGVRICRSQHSSYAEFDNPTAQYDELFKGRHNWGEVDKLESCYTEQAFEAYPTLRATTQKSR